MNRRPVLAWLGLALAGCAAHKPAAVPAGLPPAQRIALLPVLMDSQVYEAEVFESEHSDVVAAPSGSGAATGSSDADPHTAGAGALFAYIAENRRKKQAELDQAWATVEFHPRRSVDAELRRRLSEHGVAMVELADPYHRLHRARQNGDFKEWQQQADAVLDVRILDVGYYRSGSNFSPMLGIYCALIRTAYPEENGGTDYWFDSRPSKGDPNAFVCPPAMIFKSLDELRDKASDVRTSMDRALVRMVDKMVLDLRAKVRMQLPTAANPVASLP